MNIINSAKNKLADPLLTFKYFERLIAVFCTLMPVILWLADGEMQHPFRHSISNYVYMEHSYVFGMLLAIAAMLFIFNGAVYYKTEEHLHISWHGQWYNIVLGLSLIGVICFPHEASPVPHLYLRHGLSCPQPPLAVSRECQACPQVLSGQLGKVGQHLFGSHAPREVFEHVLHGNPQASDTRLAASLSRFDRDPRSPWLVHQTPLRSKLGLRK